MNKEMKKKITKFTTILITAISLVSVIGFFVDTSKNYRVIKESKELRQEIKVLHNDYIEPLYSNIISEDTSKSLSENSSYYKEILNRCEEIEGKEEELSDIENSINDIKLGNYISNSRSFINSVKKVYTLLKEGSEGDFSNLSSLSEKESSSYINQMKSNYDALVKDYKSLKFENKNN
ncbi:hypothetical protein SAMN04487886_103319 [Clostridium sp. DSM 8431]|uniref:hypothetical protein n=1 Tax=Clostridium sp. DSM 8431 TaxID=1761781 RepID=UPI0008E627B9|nr:hypothetical protein [Clostridium sp. DSM 8431]SFU46142.1 hypothetical protein SAMN04487886_103319 [Clostridium sp. DSM 8431]